MAVAALFGDAKCSSWVLLVLLMLCWVSDIDIANGVFLANANADPPRPSLGGESLLNFLRMHRFDSEYANQWGPQHQNVSADGKLTTIWIDASSGSGFKSKQAYMYGLFNAAVKLQAGYTAGIVTTFYLSNNEVYEGKHDEVDFEFLGRVAGEAYTLQTNVYGNGSGDGPNVVGREQRFHLWFDPTQEFHDYTIVWTPQQILWLVDGIVIRRFLLNNNNNTNTKKQQLTATATATANAIFPSKPMSAYATIWDGSDWATHGGRYRANYSYAPFVSHYSRFVTIGCQTYPSKTKGSGSGSNYCSALRLLECVVSPGGVMDKHQVEALQIVRKHYMTYDYCYDYQRYPKGSMPDCNTSPPPAF